MAQTLYDISKSLNLSESYVQNPIAKILLCGGPLSQHGEPPSSMRGVLNALINLDPSVSPHIVLAEDAAKWYRSIGPEHFTDLVQFEMQIADLSTMILLIVESPGSMTELGAFSYVDRLLKKLYVVLETSHQDDRSFIMDGPIAKVRYGLRSERESKRFYTCHWLQSAGGKIEAAAATSSAHEILNQLILPAINEPSARVRFKKTDIGHQMLLIADLVSLCGAVRLTEIFEILGGLGIKVKRKVVEQYLSLLQNMHFLARRHEGSDDYFVQIDSTLKFLNYSVVGGRPFDRVRLQSDIRKTLSFKPNDKKRQEAFNAVKRRAQP